VNIEPNRVIEALKQRVTALTMDNALMAAAVEQLTAEKEQLEMRLLEVEQKLPAAKSNGHRQPAPRGGDGK
jgi:ABC-type phosphate transport system auxiliary subunit